MTHRYVVSLLGLAAVWGALTPAQAYKWPGTAPAPGGAISAKVIGQRCPGVLSSYEITELDAYLDKAGRELDARAEPEAAPFATFATGLTATYEMDHAAAKSCNAEAEEEARDMLHRVRRVMVSSAPLYPTADDPNRRPDIAEAMRARLAGEKCNGLAALDLAELDVYIAKSWVWWAKHASDADARLTMDLYKASSRRMEAEWQAEDCSANAMAKARETLALVRRTSAAKTLQE